RLGRDEPHVGSGDRLADRFGVSGIVLLPLDVGLHVSRRHQPHRMPKRLQFARPMMRCRAGLHTNEARRHFLEERQDGATRQWTREEHVAIGVNAVHLKTRLGDVETDCLNCLHVWLLSIVGALTAPTFMALARRWRSRPQHQKRTCAVQSRCPLWAKSGLMQCSKKERYSITASARAKSAGAISIPRLFAAFRLRMSVNLSGCSIGRFAGLSPRRM